MDRDLYNLFESLVTEHKRQLFARVIENRTKYITVVLEDIYQPQNASAVLRSCDCTGIQDVHIIENEHVYEVNPDVALGSSKWLNLNKYNSENDNTSAAINKLRKDGYRIVATTPHSKDTLLPDFDIHKGKVAVFFGRETTGLTQNMMDQADEFIRIPMVGFTESFNISVSAAITLYTLSQKMKMAGVEWKLSTEEREKILFDWYYKCVKRAETIEKAFYQRNVN